MDTFFPQAFTLLSLGLVLGLEHALDADHVVAVSTLVSQTKSLRRSSIFGILWGMGHTTTLFVVGLVILLFKLTIPQKLALSFEFLVGIVLVLLGVDVLRKVLQGRVHLHPHTHPDGTTHVHLHAHDRPHGEPHDQPEESAHHHHHRSFLVGLVHGLAGSSALMLLVLTTVESVWQGIFFILIFGVGSILGMMVTSTLIALPMKAVTNFARVDRGLRLAAGVISIVLGVLIMGRIGFVDGLFL